MFRPGENWVYDLFIFFLKIYWNIFKAILFVVVMLIRARPRPLERPRLNLPHGGIPLAQVKSIWADVFASVCFISGGGLILGGMYLSTFAPLLIRLLAVGAGIGLMGFAILRQLRTDRNRQHVHNPEEIPHGTKEATDSPSEVSAKVLPAIVYAIRLPRQTQPNGETALQFVHQLAYSFPQLLLSIHADHEQITWQVIDATQGVQPYILEQLIRTSYPEAEIEVTLHESQDVSAPFYRYVCSYRQRNMFVAPLVYIDAFKAFDPLNALTQVMSGLQPGERITFVLALAGIAHPAYKHGERLITQSTIHPLQFLARGGVGDAAGKILSRRDRTEKYEYRDQKILEDKLRAKLYYAYLWVQVDAPERARIADLLAMLDTEIDHFTRMPFNTLEWVERPLETYTHWIRTLTQEQAEHVLTFYRQITTGTLGKKRHAPPFLILEPREIAALWHLPSASFSAPRVSWASGLNAVSEAVARLDDGAVLGVGKYQGREVPIRIPLADRVTHSNIVGRTGTGKSTLLHTLIHQDIASGAGVAVIDPHGQLVRDVLRSSIPPSREADVVVLDLADLEHPPPLNPLSSIQGYASTLKIVGVIERLFAGTEGAARMASYLRAALIPLSDETQPTMRDVTRMFMDDVYREQRLSMTDDPETVDFWDYQYNSASPAMQRQIAEPIINRIRPFYANPTLYPILCHPDLLDLRAMMQEKKILLISLALDEERVPEQERNLIGALLLSQLQMASMKAKLQEPFHLYVDEVQRFVTTSLSEMLSEARKYGLSLTIANQYLGQLTGKTLEAVMGNVGTNVIFRCSPDDARDLAAYTKPHFDAQALMDLDRFQAVVKLQVQGATQPAFNLLTLPPLEQREDGEAREARIRQQSRTQYTPKTRAEVLDWLRDRYPRRRVPAVEATPADEATFYE